MKKSPLNRIEDKMHYWAKLLDIEVYKIEKLTNSERILSEL